MANLRDFVEKHLLLPKLLYFVLNVLVYSTYTFTADFFEKVWGVAGHHFGYIVALCAISFTGSLLWTMLADRTGRHKLILLIATILHVLSFFLLKSTFLTQSGDLIRIGFVAFSYGLANFFTSAFYPLLDSRVFILLSKDPRFSKELYGRQRLFGTLGQSAITAINGAAIVRFGFDAIFISLVISASLFVLLIIFGIPPDQPTTKKERKLEASTLDNSSAKDHEQMEKSKIESGPLPLSSSTSSSLPAPTPISMPSPTETSTPLPAQKRGWLQPARLLFNFDYIFFLLIILIAGTTRGVAGNYLPQYFTKTLKFPHDKIGLVLQTRIITEVLVFIVGKQMLQWMGVHWMLLLAQFSGFLRVFSYAILPCAYPWTLMPLLIELLKGVNNACLISAGARYVHDYAPIGTEATAQGFFSGVHSYLANAVSGFFGALILQMHKDDPNSFQILFQYTSIISFIGLGAYILRHLFATKMIHHPSLGKSEK